MLFIFIIKIYFINKNEYAFLPFNKSFLSFFILGVQKSSEL